MRYFGLNTGCLEKSALLIEFTKKLQKKYKKNQLKGFTFSYTGVRRTFNPPLTAVEINKINDF